MKYFCSFYGCERIYFHKNNLFVHENNHYQKASKEKGDNLIFTCDHTSCFLKFKTKRQKSMHHNKLENECKLEKNTLIRLIGKFKNILFALKKRFNWKNLEQNQSYIDLRNDYTNLIKNRLMDPEFFFSVLGENFEK